MYPTEAAALRTAANPATVERYAPYVSEPGKFARDVLKFTPVPRQERMWAGLLAPPYRVLAPSANEQGKTAASAVAALWWHCTRRPAIILSTAPKYDQVRDLLWKEMRRLAARGNLGLQFQPKACRIERAPDDFAVGLTARDATSFQGHHGPNMLFIVDEGTGVAAEFFEAIESMFSPPGHALIVPFNPTTTSCHVYLEYSKVESADRRGDGPPWTIVAMSALDHPNIDAELRGRPPVVPHAMRLDKFDRLLRQWSTLTGANPDLPVGAPGGPEAGDIAWPPVWATRLEGGPFHGQPARVYRPGPEAEARLLARFPTQGTTAVWGDGDWLAACRELPGLEPLDWPEKEVPPVPEVGCDVARFGDDKTEIHARCGPISLSHEAASKRPTDQTAGRLIEVARGLARWWNERTARLQEAIRPRPITEFDIPLKVDDDGVGCMIAGTRVLTLRGWLPVEEVQVGDRLYSKSEVGDVTIETVVENTKRDPTRVLATGPYAFSAGHFLPYKTRREYPWRLGSWDSVVGRGNVWLDTEFRWAGADTDLTLPAHEITMPNGGTRQYRGEATLPGDPFCEFLGWFISEGSFDGRWILLTQKGESGCAEIERVLADLGISYTRKSAAKGNSWSYMIGHQSLRRWLEEHCYHPGEQRGALRKRVPSYVGEQTPRRINLFLDAYTRGDGFFQPFERGCGRHISTSSRLAADDLQTLFLKVGRYTGIRVHNKAGSLASIGGRAIVRTADNYRLAEWAGTAITVQPRDVAESVEHVYEVRITGPTRLFMVKFANERPFWCHNGGLTDILSGQGYNVVRVSAASTPNDEEHYPNKRSELWFVTAEMARSGRLDLSRLDPDTRDELRRQAMTAKWSLDSQARRVVMPKDKIKAELGRSPDGADALNLAYFPATASGPGATTTTTRQGPYPQWGRLR